VCFLPKGSSLKIIYVFITSEQICSDFRWEMVWILKMWQVVGWVY
jgi:hypothetical protein